MRIRLTIILAILVATPLALLAWMGVRGVRVEREMAARRIEDLLRAGLEEAARPIRELLDERARELGRVADSLPSDSDGIRDWLRRIPCATQCFVLDPDGNRLHPPPEGPLTEAEREFLARAAQVWRDKGKFFEEPETRGERNVRPTSSGWYAWYSGSDVGLLRWQRLASGSVLGVELSRARFIADAIARFPAVEASEEDPAGAAERPGEGGRIRLVDSAGETLYQWGSREPGSGERPAATLELAPPLAAWRFERFAAGEPLAEALSRRLLFQLFLGVAAVGLALAGLAAYFYRESARDFREARQRVTFVNRVSHELKTPLTNIRMYAELLEELLERDGGKALEHCRVVASESQRLSRLIGNVLAFARRERGALELHPRPGSIDETIARVVERFRPALAARGIEARFSGGAPGRVLFDSDALEQILNNLLSNAEKYAPGSGVLEVSSREEAGRATIVVADRGPGIPEREREAVFRPFHRLSDRLDEGASGTGLGLSIARELARLHGGDVRLVPSERGARFEVTLDAPGGEP